MTRLLCLRLIAQRRRDDSTSASPQVKSRDQAWVLTATSPALGPSASPLMARLLGIPFSETVRVNPVIQQIQLNGRLRNIKQPRNFMRQSAYSALPLVINAFKRVKPEAFNIQGEYTPNQDDWKNMFC